MIDVGTVPFVSSVVMLTIAVVYLGTFLIRRDDGGARIWAFGYLLTILAIVSYAVWAVGDPVSGGSIAALAMAQGATVGTSGCFALGFLAYNGRPLEGPSFVVTACALLCAAASVVDALTGGSPEQPWTWACVGFLSLWTTVAALRGPMRGFSGTWLLAATAAVQGLFALCRAGAYVVAGPDSEAARVWFGEVSNSFIIATFGVAFSIFIFVLRTAVAGAHGRGLAIESDEILDNPALRRQLRGLLRRATARMENVAVIAARIDALEEIAGAFGGDISEDMVTALRQAARYFASPLALVGEGEDPTVVYVATVAPSQADARRQAGLLYRGIVQDFIDGRDLVLPGIGVGVALSQTLGYDGEALMEAARAAAVEAAANEEASVEFASIRNLGRDPFPAEPA